MVAIARDLADFESPLDLLLSLVRRNRYPLDALPIAEITGQYLSYIKEAGEADVELGGDFLETASWLVLLKSRAMLPRCRRRSAAARPRTSPARPRDSEIDGRTAAQTHR